MKELLAASRAIDKVSEVLGRSVAWLVVAAAVISAGNAVVRKAFDWSANSLLEVQWWLFAVVFLLAAPWTLAVNEHIRVDVVNSRLSKRKRDIIELVGHTLFLLPVAAMVTYTSWIFFFTSYAQGEQSSNAGGLPQWPIKALIPIAFAWLFVQGLSELIKRIAIMRGDLAETDHGSFHEAAVQVGAESGGTDGSSSGREDDRA